MSDSRTLVHEAGHIAILSLHPELAEIVVPGGVAVGVPVAGQAIRGGCVWSGTAEPERLDPRRDSDRLWLLDDAPHLLREWCMFALGGWAAELEILGPIDGCMPSTRAMINLSGDGRDCWNLLAGTFGSPVTREAEYFIRGVRVDIFEQAREIFRRQDVRAGVLALATWLRAERRLSWTDAKNIFSAHIAPMTGETVDGPVGASGNVPLAGDLPETEPGTARSIPSKLLRQKPTQ